LGDKNIAVELAGIGLAGCQQSNRARYFTVAFGDKPDRALRKGMNASGL
jgi:hypothetical protein